MRHPKTRPARGSRPRSGAARSGAAAAGVAIEPLEDRTFFSLFLNDIDSSNLGKGMWAWTLSTSMTNDGFSTSNYSGWFGYLKNTMHLDYVITKAGSGDSLLSQYNSTVVNAAHNAGLKIFPYFYIYGDHPDGVTGTHTSSGEAAVFNSVFDSGGPGGDAAIFDIESEYGNTDSAGLINYFNLIGKSASGNGSGSRDRLFMAYSSFDILHFHYTQFPAATIADYCDAAMPQMYWMAHGYSVAFDISTTDADYKNTAYVGVNGVKPVIPTGQSYDSSSAGDGSELPPGTGTDSIHDFYTQIKADSNAVGGGIAGYRYKSINYFDEHSLDRKGSGALITPSPGEKTEIAAETIGDLPGTPAVTSPANGATGLNRNSIVLNWSDVVNTYGTGSVGAALYYDVYLDNMTTPVTTIAYSAPAAPVSQWTVPSTITAGTHQWKVVARNMFGSTTSPTWSFSVTALPAPAVPSNPSPNGVVLNSKPVTLNWDDSANATTYDVYFGTNPTPQRVDLTASQVTGLNPADGVQLWRVVAKNADGSSAGPQWSYTLDTTPPTASYGGEAPAAGTAFLDFTITYADATTALDTTSLDDNDVTVSGPGFASPVAATYQGVSGNVVTYRVAAPGGTWDVTDAGSYTVAQVASQVKDTAGNYRAAGTVGTINAQPAFAWMSGSTLHVDFDGTAAPITLGTSGADVTATRGATTLTFGGVTALLAAGTDNDDALQFAAALAAPLTFNNAGGNDSVHVMTGGSYTFGADAGGPLRNVAVVVDYGAVATFGVSQHLRNLSVDGLAMLAAGHDKVLVTKALSVTGQLDLTDNALVVDYTPPGGGVGPWQGSAYGGVTGLIASGRNGGDWGGSGIVTTSAGMSDYTTLGIAEASETLGISGSEVGTFAGESVDASSVLVKFTYGGDANLDGQINIDDYTQIDSSAAAGGALKGFFNGDFNYDGAIDIDDYTVIDSNIAIQGPPL